MDFLLQHHDRIKRCGAALLEKKLVWGSSGNISVRVDSERFLITAAGSSLGMLGGEDLVVCPLEMGTAAPFRRRAAPFDGMPRTPSMEIGLHRRIYQACREAEAIIHSQPFYSTLVACSEQSVEVDLLPETMAYLGTVERVPYFHAGSEELAEATAARAEGSRALLLENHGVVCWGSSLVEALLKTETLELLCRMMVEAKAAGVRLTYLGDEVQKDFRRHLERLQGGDGRV